jgi:hypothetical protein
LGAALAGPAAGNSLFTAGTVGLYDAAGNAEANATLTKSGAAELTTVPLTIGANSFYVVYSGSAYAAPSQSANVVLSAAGPAADFTLSGANAVSLAAGSSTSASLTLTPVNGFNQSIDLSCTGLPAGYTCRLPATLAPIGTTSITVIFAAPSPTTPGAATSLAFLVLLMAGGRKRRNRLVAVLAIIMTTALLGGCAAAVGNNRATTQDSQSYLAIVTASSGSISHQLAIEVTVTQ